LLVLSDQEIIGVKRIDWRRLHADGAPIRAKLVGQDLRQRGVDALAHLGLRHDNRHLSIAADLEERVEDDLPRREVEIGPIAARPYRPGQQQPDPCPAADQQRSSIDVDA